jgi:hypothetical protein
MLNSAIFVPSVAIYLQVYHTIRMYQYPSCLKFHQWHKCDFQCNIFQTLTYLETCLLFCKHRRSLNLTSRYQQVLFNLGSLNSLVWCCFPQLCTLPSCSPKLFWATLAKTFWTNLSGVFLLAL